MRLGAHLAAGHDRHARGLRQLQRRHPRHLDGRGPDLGRASSSATAPTSAAAPRSWAPCPAAGTQVISIGRRCLLGANAGHRHQPRRRLRRRGRLLRHGRHQGRPCCRRAASSRRASCPAPSGLLLPPQLADRARSRRVPRRRARSSAQRGAARQRLTRRTPRLPAAATRRDGVARCRRSAGAGGPAASRRGRPCSSGRRRSSARWRRAGPGCTARSAALPVRPHCTATALGDGTAELDPEQAGNAAIIAAVAVRRGLPARAATIGIATAMQESKLRNLDYGDRDSLGLFQQRPSQGWGTAGAGAATRSTRRNAFYDVLVKIEGYQNLPITDGRAEGAALGVPERLRRARAARRGSSPRRCPATPRRRLTCVLRRRRRPGADAGRRRPHRARARRSSRPARPRPAAPAGRLRRGRDGRRHRRPVRRRRARTAPAPAWASRSGPSPAPDALDVVAVEVGRQAVAPRATATAGWTALERRRRRPAPSCPRRQRLTSRTAPAAHLRHAPAAPSGQRVGRAPGSRARRRRRRPAAGGRSWSACPRSSRATGRSSPGSRPSANSTVNILVGKPIAL